MDINYNSVSLLLLGNGTNGSTTITDNSPSPVTVTATGSAQISTAQSKFGGASLLLTSGSLTTSAYDGLGFGTGDFTIEFWLHRSNNNVSVYPLGITHSGVGLFLALDCPGGGAPAAIKLSNAGGNVVTSAYGIAMDAWSHVAVVRASGVANVYIDGAGTTGGAFSTDLHTSGSLKLNGTGYGDLTGYIDDLRITKGVARYTSNFVAPIAEFDTFSPTYADISCPSPVLEFTASPTVNHASFGLAPPSPTTTAYTGASAHLIAAPSPVVRSAAGAYVAPITAPSPTLQFTAHDSTGENAITALAPSPTLSFYTGAVIKAKAPSPTVAITGTVTNWAKANVKPPSPIVSATATVSGMASITVKAPSPNLVGYGGAVCSVSVTGSPTLQASVTVGGVASAALTCPLFELTSTASIGNVASANLIAPSPQLGQTIQAWLTAPSARLTAIGTAVVTATYEAYAINLGHRPRVTSQEQPVDEVTRYTNFPFTHVVRYRNSYYGANSTGLYLLEGTTDDGDAIEFAVKTAMTDFDSPLKKTVASAYFGGRLGPDATITLHAGEGAQTQPYSYTTPRGALAQNYRQAFGRGLKARYYQMSIAGTGPLELDNIELDTKQLTRRI